MALKFKVLIAFLIIWGLVLLLFFFKFSKKETPLSKTFKEEPRELYGVTGLIKEIKEGSIILEITNEWAASLDKKTIEVLVGDKTTIEKIVFSEKGIPQEEKAGFKDLKEKGRVNVFSSQNIWQDLKSNTPFEAMGIVIFP